MFGYGAREAVVAAIVGNPEDLAPFGRPASAEELAAVVELVTGEQARVEGPGLVVAGPPDQRLAPLAHAHGWRLVDRGPDDPSDPGGADARPEAHLRPAGP
jgi:hypothetical protein